MTGRILSLVWLVLIIGCNSEQAQLGIHKRKPILVHFVTNLAQSEDTGGLMFWGKSVEGDIFGRPGGKRAGQVEVNPGTWTFYAMSWSGGKLAGDVRCAIGSQTLSGSGKRIQNMTFTNSTCVNNSEFVGTDPQVVNSTGLLAKLGSLRVQFCESLTNINDGSDACTDALTTIPLDPTPPYAEEEWKGQAMSFRLQLSSFDRDNGQDYKFFKAPLYSKCIVGSGGNRFHGLAAEDVPQVPAGFAGSTPFFIKMEVFPGSYTCDTLQAQHVVEFPTGVDHTSSAVKYYVGVGADIDPDPLNTVILKKHEVFIKMSKDEICKGPALTSTFAGGNGSQAAPYLICNVNQFYNMIGKSGKSFKLLDNIDLTPYYKGINSHPGLPNYSCLKDGSNFYPLGYTTGCTAGNFTGTFDGGGKTITGLRIIMPDKLYVGMISQMGAEQHFRRVRFDKAFVDGYNHVGIAMGISSSGVSSLNHHVEIHNSKVRAWSRGGSLGGTSGSGTTTFVKVAKFKVDCTGTYCGGLFGQTNDGPTIQDTLVQAEVVVAGIAGGFIAGVGSFQGGKFLRSRFEGSVVGGVSVGGLAGEAGALTIDSCYVHGSVQSRNPPSIFGTSLQFTGGLVGNFGTAPGVYALGGSGNRGEIHNTYFLGTIGHGCSAIGFGCYVGNLFGGSAGNWQNNAVFSNVFFSTPEVNPALTSHTTEAFRVSPDQFITGNPAVTDITPAARTLPAVFSYRLNDIPRLPIEAADHPCRTNDADLSVAAQKALATPRGSRTNPILLCNGSQIPQMQASGADHYKLMSYIYDFNTQAVSAGVLSGSIDGNGFGLIGKRLEPTANNQTISWWDTITDTGSIFNLSLLGPYIHHTVGGTTYTGGSAALIARVNDGDLTNLKIISLQSQHEGALNIGSNGVVSENADDGLISNLFINGAVFASTNFSGVANKNFGVIEDVINELFLFSGTFSNFSGLVSDNSGTIERVESGITAVVTQNTRHSAYSEIVQTNSGLLKDIHIRGGYFNGSGDGIHGVARVNTGDIKGVVHQKRVELYDRTTVPMYAPATDPQWENHLTNLVATSSGTMEGMYYFYEPRWFYGRSGLRFAPILGSVFTPTPSGDDCIVEMYSPDFFTTLSGGWDTFIENFGAVNGRIVLAPTSTSAPVHFVVDHDSSTSTASFIGLTLRHENRDCSATTAGTSTHLTYIAADRYTTPQAESTLTTWSPWHEALANLSEVVNASTSQGQSRLHEVFYSFIQGNSPERPVWVFTSGSGIRLYNSVSRFAEP